MKQSMKKRLAAGFLSVCLLFSQGVIPISAYAGGTETGGLCEHHPEHTEMCGYAEGTPCNHEHTDDCYRLVEKCVHKHTADCYPEDNTDGVATPSDAEPTECGHVCSEETGCIRKVLNCQHVHDSECGFTVGHACGYVCEICGASTDKDSGTTAPTKETCSCTERCSAEQVNTDCPVCKEDYSDCTVKQKPDIAGGIITEFSRLDKDILNQEVDSGTALEALNLPDELEVSVHSEDETGESDMITVTTVAVTDWESDPAYDGETGTYVFTPELTDEYPIEEGVKTPKITVTVIPVEVNSLTVNITRWEWIDPDEHLSDGTLAFNNVNTEHQASFDEVVSLLPEQISAEIEGAAEPETINITGWKCPEYKQDNKENWPTSGSYKFIAVLPEGYSLAEDADLLEIEVLVGAANVLQEGGTGDFIVTGDSVGYEYSADSRTLTVKDGAELTISGNTSQDKIVVESDATATITLNDLSIDVSGSENACAFKIADNSTGNVTIILEGKNVLKSGANCAGLQKSGGTGSGWLTITGKDEKGDSLEATGGDYDAGIGGGWYGSGSNIEISGGTVTATGGDYGAGIGGGNYGSGSNIKISGGTVTATGGTHGAGIGGGYNATGSNIKISGGTVTATGGWNGAGIGGGYNATGSNITIEGTETVVIAQGGTDAEPIGSGKDASSTSTNAKRNGGLIIDGNSGKLYGDGKVTLTQDLEIKSGVTVTIDGGQTLTINENVTLTNNGTITNNGTFKNNGTFNGKPVSGGTVQKPSTVTVECSSSSAAYGENIKITATATALQANVLARNAAIDTVDFWLGDIDSGTKLGTADVISGSATLTMDEDIWAAVDTNWTIGDNTITADFGGTSGSAGLIENIGTAILKVSKADQPATSVAVSSTAATYGGTAPTITPVSVKDNANVTYSAVSSANDLGTMSDVAKVTGTTITLNKAGTFYVKAVIAETDYYMEKTIYSDEIKVAKADAQFTVTVKKDSMATNLFIYGDVITVEVSGIQVRTANSRSALSENNVYLFAVDPAGSPDTANAIASAAVSGGNATLTYNTGDKKIAIGNNQTLWIAYGGSGNFKSATQTVEVTLAAKPLTATVESGDASAQKSYDKNNKFSNVKLNLSGLTGSDKVTATADGMTSDSDTGARKVFTATTVTLDGADNNWYSLAASDVSGNVNITKAAGSLVISCPNVTYGTAVSPSVTTNTSNGTVTYSYEGRNDTSYGPSTTAPTNVGEYTVTGTAAATANYEQATSAPVNFEITKAAGNLIISCPNVTYGTAVSPSVTTNTSGGTVTYSYEGRDGTSYGPSAEAPSNAGTYKVTGTAEATENYEKATCSVDFEITKAAGSLVISCPNVTYGTAVSPSVTTNTGNGAVTYSYEGWDGTSYGPSTEAPTNAGTYKVTGTAEATENYENATCSVDFEITKAVGSLVISCPNVTYGTAVSPSVTTNTSNGTVTYSYEGRDGTSYGPSTEAPSNAGTYKVTGTAEATKNYGKTTSATVNFEIFKAAGESIPQVTGSYTGDGSAFTYTIDLIPGAEYSKDNSAWQDSNSFTGFSVDESVTFYARMKKDQNHTAGASNNTGTVIFTRLAKEENPALAYTITGATGNKKITITPVTGCEYTFDGGLNWDSSNEHIFATDGKPTIGIRYAKTATHEASAGATQEVDLKNLEQDAPEAFTLTFTDNGDGTFTATIPPVTGGEYSFDGANWSGVNTKKDCQPNMSYTGYVRLAVKDGYNASPATSDTKTAPRLIVAAPVIAPNGGSFIGSQNVTITTATQGASIYYTTDGTLPTSASTAYKGPFTLTDSATVQTIAVKDGYEDSPVTKATFTRTHSGGSGGGSSNDSSGNSGSSNGQTDVSAPSKPDAPTIGTITPGTPDKNGSVSISGEQVENAITNALKDAEKNRQTKNGVAIAVNLPTGASSATLDRASLKKLIDSSVKSFKLNFDGVALSFDLAALREIAGKTTGTLTFGANKATGLTGDALTVIGSRPAYNLTVSWRVNGKAAYISNFGAGSVSVAMNYTPAEKELTGSLYAIYVDGGKVEWIDKSSYDLNSKAVIFQTNHFSAYGVGYKTPPVFTDTANHWAKADIDFVVSRGLFSGTSNTTFAPNDLITRGMFVTALGRLAGIDPKAYPTSRFTDVPATADYAPYVEWAAGTGIVNGTGEKTFSPDAAVTREQMAVFMQRYANILTYTLPITREAESFVDEGQITGDMRGAVRAMQQAGIMNGKDNQYFGPKDTATRAEAAAVLRRFVTIVIDPAAAGGWAQNDTGHWLYYVDGKPVTGWKQIESKWYYFDTAGMMQSGGWRQIGGNWYYFYANGIMAVSTKIDDYEVGPDGARKEN